MLLQLTRQGQRARLGILCGLLLALAGCAAAPEPPLPAARAPEAGEAIVFGKIVLLEAGSPLPYDPKAALYPEFTVIRIADDRAFTVALAADGAFFAVLPKGAYVVDAVARRYRVPMAFVAPPDADAAYVGRLELDLVRERGLFGSWLRPDHMDVKDEGDTAEHALAARVPGFDGSLSRALMVGASQVPGAAQRLAARRRREGITPGDVLQAIIIGL